MLLDRSNLRVHSFNARALCRRAANCSGVPLQRTVDQRVNHALHVAGRLRIRERLIRRCLLQTVRVGNLAETL